MKIRNEILRVHFCVGSLVICAMILSTEMSMGQDANLQRQNVDSDSLNAWVQEHQENPLEMGNQIREAIPGTGPILNIGLGDSYFAWKDKVYDKIGLRFGVSYQMAYQYASEVVPDGKNQALSDWWGFMTKWTLINRKKGKNQGHLVFSMFERMHIGDYPNPSLFGPGQVGSITSIVEFTDWRFAIENLYWEQWIDFKNHKLMIRAGNLVAAGLIDPFRFKDARKNFSTGPFCYHVTKPDPTFGFGVLAKWIPSNLKGLYVSGAMTDMNGDPNSMGFDWSTVSYGQFFYGVEVGKNWVRGKGDYDHLHVLVFYATDRSTRNADVAPNEPGWGFSILGEKQIDNWVGFLKYTHNTSEGGGGLATFSNNTGTAGVVYKNLLNVTGSTGLGLYFMDPIDNIFGDDTGLQTGMEAYWNMLLTRNIMVTPGIHLQWNPPGNQGAFVAMPHIKFRIQI